MVSDCLPIHQPMPVTCCICMWSGSAEVCIPQDALHMWTTVWLRCSDLAWTCMSTCSTSLMYTWSLPLFNWPWPVCITPYVIHVTCTLIYFVCTRIYVKLILLINCTRSKIMFVLLCHVMHDSCWILTNLPASFMSHIQTLMQSVCHKILNLMVHIINCAFQLIA